MVKKLNVYLPERGDVIWLNFGVTAGREQAGRRPALVLSPQAYNHKTGLALVCPVTNTVRKYPFEVALPDNFPITGVILADQLKSVAWRDRNAELVAPAPPEVIDEVLGKVEALLR